MTAQSSTTFPYGPGTIPGTIPQPQPYQPYQPYRPYVPTVTPNVTPTVTTHVISQDYILTKVRAIVEMLNAKAITRAEARKMLAKVDVAFAAILG